MTNTTKHEMETIVNYSAGEQTATVYAKAEVIISMKTLGKLKILKAIYKLLKSVLV